MLATENPHSDLPLCPDPQPDTPGWREVRQWVRGGYMVSTQPGASGRYGLYQKIGLQVIWVRDFEAIEGAMLFAEQE